MIKTLVTCLEGRLGSWLRYLYYGYRLQYNGGYFASMPGFVIEGVENVSIDAGCSFNRGVYITASKSIVFGKNVIVGAYTVFRDADHGTVWGELIKNQPSVVGSIKVGDGVWIAAHCVVLRDSVIGDGCVIGANSLVKGIVPANEVWVGTPIRKLRDR